MSLLLWLGWIALTVVPSVQEKPPVHGPLSALDALIGRWEGTSEGQPGQGMVER